MRDNLTETTLRQDEATENIQPRTTNLQGTFKLQTLEYVSQSGCRALEACCLDILWGLDTWSLVLSCRFFTSA